MTTRTATACRYDRPGDDDPAAYCTTHVGWVFAGDECEGAIGSIHCNECVNAGCKGQDSCDCHQPGNPRFEGAFA